MNGTQRLTGRARHLWLLCLAALTMLSMVACSSAAPAPAAAPSSAAPAPASQKASPAAAPTTSKPLAKLKVADTHPGNGAGLLAIGLEKGYFQQEGVEIEFVTTKGGGDNVQAVVSGGADIGLNTGPMSILGAIEKGADIKIISAAQTPVEFWWLAKDDSPYKTIKDLAGQKIGYTSQGSSSNLVLLAILEKAGIDAEPVAAGGLSNQWTQVKTGQLAAGVAMPPETWRVAEREGGRRVFGTEDFPEFADYTYIVNFARSDSLKNKTEAVKAFLRGWKRTAEFIATQPEAAVKIEMNNTEIPEDLEMRYFKQLSPTQFRLQPIGGMDMSIKYAKLFKFITKDPDLNTVMDLSLIPK